MFATFIKSKIVTVKSNGIRQSEESNIAIGTGFGRFAKNDNALIIGGCNSEPFPRKDGSFGLTLSPSADIRFFPVGTEQKTDDNGNTKYMLNGKEACQIALRFTGNVDKLNSLFSDLTTKIALDIPVLIYSGQSTAWITATKKGIELKVTRQKIIANNETAHVWTKYIFLSYGDISSALETMQEYTDIADLSQAIADNAVDKGSVSTITNVSNPDFAC